MKMGILKKVVFGVMACVLSLGVAGGLSACGGNAEQVIRDGIDSELSAFKNPTKENLSKYVDEDSSSISQIKSLGVDPYEFLGHVFDKFDYEIGDIKVDGDTATAVVTVKNVDVASALEETSDYFKSSDNAAELMEIYQSDGETGLYKKFFSQFYEFVDAKEDTVSTDVTIHLTKKDNTWSIDDDSITDLVKGAYGGADLSSLE